MNASAGVKSGKAQNEHMFSGLPPKADRGGTRFASSQPLSCDFPDQPRDDVAFGLFGCDPAHNRSRLGASFASPGAQEHVQPIYCFPDRLCDTFVYCDGLRDVVSGH